MAFYISQNDTTLDEAVRIDHDGKVGIGETAPLGKLHVKNADSGVTSPDAGFDDMIVENSADVGISLLSTDTATIAFNDANGAPDGSIQYRHDDRSTRFTNSGAERMRIDVNGVVSITKAGSLFSPLSSDGLVVQHSDATGIRIIDSGNAGNNGGHVGIGNDNGNLQLSTAGVMLFDTGFEPTDQLYNGRHERMRINSSGNLLVGTTNAAQDAGAGIKLILESNQGRCFLVGDSTAGEGFSMRAGSAYKFFVGYNGTINATNTSISSISDERLKENITDLETGLSEVMSLKPRRFDWKEGEGSNTKNVAGFVAQEVETVLPDLIGGWKHDSLTDAKSVRMGDMLPTLVKAIQELTTKLEAAEARIATLEG